MFHRQGDPHRVIRINVDQNVLHKDLIVKGLFAHVLVLLSRQMRMWIACPQGQTGFLHPGP